MQLEMQRGRGIGVGRSEHESGGEGVRGVNENRYSKTVVMRARSKGIGSEYGGRGGAR